MGFGIGEFYAILEVIKTIMPLLEKAAKAIEAVVKAVKDAIDNGQPEPSDDQKLDMAVAELKKSDHSLSDNKARAAVEVALMARKKGLA